MLSACFCFQEFAPASLCRGLLTLAARSCHALQHRKLRGPGSFCPSPNQTEWRPHSFTCNTWSSWPVSCLSVMQSFQYLLHIPAPYTLGSLCWEQSLPAPTHQQGNSDSFLRSQLKITSAENFPYLLNLGVPLMQFQNAFYFLDKFSYLLPFSSTSLWPLWGQGVKLLVSLW